MNKSLGSEFNEAFTKDELWQRIQELEKQLDAEIHRSAEDYRRLLCERDELKNKLDEIEMYLPNISTKAKSFKAKLIIEMPERKKEFTESELVKSLHRWVCDFRNPTAEEFIKELFND